MEEKGRNRRNPEVQESDCNETVDSVRKRNSRLKGSQCWTFTRVNLWTNLLIFFINDLGLNPRNA